MGKSMTAAEFVAHWDTPDEDGMTALDWWREGHAEAVAQYKSECGLYGDAGPGQGINVREGARSIAKIERQLARCKAQLAK